MWIREFIKKLLTTNTIWGSRAAKLAGINDRACYGAYTSISFNAATNTITAGPATVIPDWLAPDKYFRFYTVGPLTVPLPMTPNIATNEFKLFRVKTLVISGGNLVITVDPAAPDVNAMATTAGVSGYLDSRFSITINDPDIAKYDLSGSTVYNLDNETVNNRCDGSGIAATFANHYHYTAESNDNVCVHFLATDWVDHHIEVISAGVPNAGQIGPHGLSGTCFQIRSYHDLPGGLQREIELTVRVDSGTGSVHLYKAARVADFGGRVMIERAGRHV